MNKLLFAFSTFLATQAYAQERPTLETYLEEISGQEVTFNGQIGYEGYSDPDLKVATESTRFLLSTVSAIPRDQLAALEGCKATPRAVACTADISAELDFKEGRLVLIVFDVQNVVHPE